METHEISARAPAKPSGARASRRRALDIIREQIDILRELRAPEDLLEIARQIEEDAASKRARNR